MLTHIRNSMTTVITSDLIPLRERGRFQSYGNIAYAVSALDFFFITVEIYHV